MTRTTYTVTAGGRQHTVVLGDDSTVEVDGSSHTVDVRPAGQQGFSILVDGQSTSAIVHRTGTTYQVIAGGVPHSVHVESERQTLLKKIAGVVGTQKRREEITAPMPALVIRIQVQEGARVEKGQGLIVLEAMKMENEIKSPDEGVVKRIAVTAGSTVEKGQILVTLE
jgi:biotin carboxyl carrier protein